MALVISTWLWGTAYGPDYVMKLAAGVRRHLKQPHRFVCVTDLPGVLEDTGIERIYIPEVDRPLLAIKGCFARLRMFDTEWQHVIGLEDRLVCIDLDTVITGPLDPLFDRPEPFVILQGGNYSNPCPYGGALMMLRPGAHPEVWSEFSIEKAAKIPFHEFPDDQGWIWHVVPNAAGWKCGPQSGVFVFRKPPWPVDDYLPNDARIVTFSGWRNPEKFKTLRWVKKNWI